MNTPNTTPDTNPSEPTAKDKVTNEIKTIMAEYRRQEQRGGVDTPGGLEHMGDVWRLLYKWDAMLTKEAR